MAEFVKFCLLLLILTLIDVYVSSERIDFHNPPGSNFKIGFLDPKNSSGLYGIQLKPPQQGVYPCVFVLWLQDVNKPYEVEHIETQFCEAEFAHIDDSKNIDILKGKVSSSHHFIDNLNFFYSTSKNKPANTVDAVALLHTDYAISGSKSAE